jgi:DNA polymerase-3 subunit delta'
LARFVLANPDPTAKAVREARNLQVEPTHSAARLLAGLAHPDFALIRREWQPAAKRLATEISVDAVRQGLQVFQLSAAFGGWRIVIVDSAEDLNRNSANALLKMVEEPPQRSLILIVSHRPGQILPTIRSRCRRLRLDPLSEDEIVQATIGLGPPWSEAGRNAIEAAARRADGSIREALIRLAPESEGVGALIDSIVAGLPRPDPRAVARLADAIGGRAGDEAYRAFHRELYHWLVTYARDVEPGSLRVEEIGELWDRIRDAERETEELNLDRKLHILAMFAEIAATAPRGSRDNS